MSEVGLKCPFCPNSLHPSVLYPDLEHCDRCCAYFAEDCGVLVPIPLHELEDWEEA